MRGLRKNIYQLENFILSHSIDFMGAVEVHITNYTQTPEIPGYKSVTATGSERSMGIVIYIKDTGHNTVKSYKSTI